MSRGGMNDVPDDVAKPAPFVVMALAGAVRAELRVMPRFHPKAAPRATTTSTALMTRRDPTSLRCFVRLSRGIPIQPRDHIALATQARNAPAMLAKLFARKPPAESEIFRAVDGISFTVGHGESVGLVGESGCGKSTTSMMVMRLLDQTSGRIMFDGEEIGGILPNAFARLPQRKSIQMVFQDPTDSLNPRFTAARAIADPIMRLGDISGRDAVRARCDSLQSAHSFI